MHEHPGHLDGLGPIAIVGAAVAASAYLIAAAKSRRPWPRHRVLLWLAGVASALAAVVGPLADASHADFAAHMVGHVLLGMLAPLLLVLAMPVTLLLRTVKVGTGRRVSAVLTSAPARLLTHPITALVLDIGGMWVLYTTDLYAAMGASSWVAAAVHAHVIVASYLFTASMIGSDPAPHRRSIEFRSVVMVVAIAGHGILAKYLYAHPPAGVGRDEAETGSQIMYYAGDAVQLVVIVFLWAQWYSSRTPVRAASLARG